MNREEWVFEELKKGKQWEDITSGSGKSTSYKGLQKYTAWVGPRVKEMQTTISTLEDKAEALQTKVAGLEASYNSKQGGLKIIEGEITDLSQKKAAFESDISVLEARQTKLNEFEENLNQRGITLELVENIAATDVNTPMELIKRTRTAAESEAEEERLSVKKLEYQKLEANFSALGKQIDNTKQEAVFLEAKLVNVKKQVKLNEESNLIVQDAFARGYSPETLNRLFEHLQRFEVKGSPEASIKKLIRGFDAIREFDEIDYKNKLKTAQLEQTTFDLAKMQGMMTTSVDTFIPTMNKASTKVIAEITALRDAAEKHINELSLKQQVQISRMEKNAEGSLAVLNEFTLQEQRKTLGLLNQSIVNMSNAFKGYNEDIKQWGIIREEVGQYERLLQNTAALLAAVKDPNVISKVPPDFITSLLKGIHTYIQVKLPDAKSLPSPHLKKEESWAFPSIYEAKIKNVSAWLLEDLTRRYVEGQL